MNKLQCLLYKASVPSDYRLLEKPFEQQNKKLNYGNQKQFICKIKKKKRILIQNHDFHPENASSESKKFSEILGEKCS